MKLKSFTLILAVAAAALVGVSPAFAAPATISVAPSVLSQVCLDGNTVQVTLTATATSDTAIRGYRWDSTNNRSWDTPLLADPTVVFTYADEITVTARVLARNVAGERVQATVSFQTLRCI